MHVVFLLMSNIPAFILAIMLSCPRKVLSRATHSVRSFLLHHSALVDLLEVKSYLTVLG